MEYKNIMEVGSKRITQNIIQENKEMERVKMGLKNMKIKIVNLIYGFLGGCIMELKKKYLMS